MESTIQPISARSRTAFKTVAHGNKRAYEVTKRLFDIIFSLTVLLFFLPILALIAAAVVIDDFGNPFFIQKRVGKNGAIFRIIKFRSMYKNAEKQRYILEDSNLIKDGPIFKMKNDPRATRLGRLLRKTSLDELPQLINILMGDMSVVGPRPLIPSEQPQCGPEAKRLGVIPGLTGLWQVNGRNDTTYCEMMELDLKYIREKSFSLDLRIIWRTAGAVLRSKGAY
ncbi:MAG: sugar transferase [Clostridiales bacterium]|jgi:lipopolysaccharide/colanic/teichoic acid biosynthesis glycosyltransferase|nr:sugar transferase [Clostridiales bacterium]